jgi:hypothetical protein
LLYKKLPANLVWKTILHYRLFPLGSLKPKKEMLLYALQQGFRESALFILEKIGEKELLESDPGFLKTLVQAMIRSKDFNASSFNILKMFDWSGKEIEKMLYTAIRGRNEKVILYLLDHPKNESLPENVVLRMIDAYINDKLIEREMKKISWETMSDRKKIEYIELDLWRDHTRVFDLLVEKGLLPDKKGMYKGVLQAAIAKRHDHIAEDMIAAGFPLDSSCLDYAITNENVELVKLIFSRNIRGTDETLSRAIESENLEILREVMKHPVKVTVDALWRAMSRDNIRLANWILKRGLLGELEAIHDEK